MAGLMDKIPKGFGKLPPEEQERILVERVGMPPEMARKRAAMIRGKVRGDANIEPVCVDCDADGGRGNGGGDWLSRVPEPWISVLSTEIHSRSHKARRTLDTAAGDEEKLREARERIVKMGLDPDGVPSAKDLGT